MKTSLLAGKKTLLLLLTLLFYGAAQAQSNDSLVVLWLSEPGTRLSAIFSDGFESGDVSALRDANGDGLAEMILQRENNQGALQGLLAIDLAASLDTLWRIQDVQGLLTDDGTLVLFKGFADADGDGFREAVFVNKSEVALVDPRDPKVINWSSSFAIGFPPELRLLAIADMNDDGSPEIVAALPDTRQVIVFGDNPATSAQR